MKKLLFLSVAATLISSLSFATIRRVGYGGIAVTGVDYSDVQTANDAATAGDTLQIYGSVGGGTIDRKLVILGFGYNTDNNTGLQANQADEPSHCGNIYFTKGSNGSQVSGCAGSFYVYDQSGTNAAISNITFFRCKGAFYLYNNIAYGPISNINIFSSVVSAGGMVWSGSTDYAVTNVNLFNCILQSDFNMYKPGSSVFAQNCVSFSSSISGGGYLNFNDAGGLVKNCILNSYGNTTNTIYQNNFFQSSAPSPALLGSNNLFSQNFATIFTRNGRADDQASYAGFAEFDEDYWVLKTGSPAIGAGISGTGTATDCGIYGGDAATKYKLSGIPAIPAIYQLTAPALSTSTNPYNVTISVRSNN